MNKKEFEVFVTTKNGAQYSKKITAPSKAEANKKVLNGIKGKILSIKAFQLASPLVILGGTLNTL